MMIQMNAIMIRVVPGSQAAEPKRRQRNHRRPQTTPSNQTMQDSRNSGDAAQRYRTMRASPVPTMTMSSGGDFTAANTSRTIASTAQNSAGHEKPAMRQPGGARISEIADEEVCPSCQCLLTRSEMNQNKVGRARRGRCTDCYLRAPLDSLVFKLFCEHMSHKHFHGSRGACDSKWKDFPYVGP